MKDILKNAIKNALEQLNDDDIEIEINKQTLHENGDY